MSTGNATWNAVDLFKYVAAYGTKAGMHDAAIRGLGESEKNGQVMIPQDIVQRNKEHLRNKDP